MDHRSSHTFASSFALGDFSWMFRPKTGFICMVNASQPQLGMQSKNFTNIMFTNPSHHPILTPNPRARKRLNAIIWRGFLNRIINDAMF